MKRNDILLLVMYLIMTIAMTWYVVSEKINSTADQIKVYSNGEVIKSLPYPAEDQTFEVSNELGHMTIHVEGGYVSVTEADCPDHVCVKTKPIHFGGEMIVCLPNKMYVEIQSKKGETSDVDVLSQ